MFLYERFSPERTLTETIDLIEFGAKDRLKPYFDKAGVSFYPKKIVLLGFKREKKLELWVENENKATFIRTYDVLAASGKLGPKLIDYSVSNISWTRELYDNIKMELNPYSK